MGIALVTAVNWHGHDILSTSLSYVRKWVATSEHPARPNQLAAATSTPFFFLNIIVCPKGVKSESDLDILFPS